MIADRSGIAVVAALAVVALAGALLVSVACATSMDARAARTALGALAAESAARRALAHQLASWEPARDSLVVGASRAAPPRDETEADLPVQVRCITQRLAPTLFVVTADARVGPDGSLARRRVRLLVQRYAPGDSLGVPGAPAPIAHWSMVDLY